MHANVKPFLAYSVMGGYIQRRLSLVWILSSIILLCSMYKEMLLSSLDQNCIFRSTNHYQENYGCDCMDEHSMSPLSVMRDKHYFSFSWAKPCERFIFLDIKLLKFNPCLFKIVTCVFTSQNKFGGFLIPSLQSWHCWDRPEEAAAGQEAARPHQESLRKQFLPRCIVLPVKGSTGAPLA